jgi:chitinase
MSSLTWEDVRKWKGEHWAVTLNGSTVTSNATGAFLEEKIASDDFYAKGGNFMFDQGFQMGSNQSILGEESASNSSHVRHTSVPVTTNSSRISNRSADPLDPKDTRMQRGHREPREPIPDILNLGTAYILGNIDSGSGVLQSVGGPNNSSTSGTNDFVKTTSKDRSSSQSKRAHFRRHVSAHQHGTSHHHSNSHQHEAFEAQVLAGQDQDKQVTSPNTTPFTLSLHKRVDGPIQCGPGSPCKDNSCCGPEGKCGYKEHNCGAGCTSNCDAKAMCGIDSADGKTPCALKLCCSYYGWCGTEDVHCYDPEPQFGKTPCQQGFGSCQKYPSPSCSGNSASTGRRVGYYAGWNTRERLCDKVSPSQINTKGLTHLFYSFVFFDPSSFNIVPMNAADVDLYREFTKLATNGLQTWMAIGGWSFSDEGPYRTAWSDMCGSAANRAAFIKSTIAFMEQYGFQGADLDWEYPAEVKRGGRPGDADNLVLLVKEMKAAFAGRFGLSLTLAPDYWYLRGFKPKAMEPYVDFFGFMAYDLHGPWDTDVKALGSIVRPQTDITEIYQNFKPLWFDGVDPKKVNMGLAYYGRSYKLADASCSKMGCAFKGPGAAGECTAFEGVLSNREIQSMIKKEGITPYFNQTAMVKYFTYAGDSWVGYDDQETLALKESFANSLCLGGLMIWSIDYDAQAGAQLPSDTGNDKDLVWVSPEIWKQPNPQVYCQFPCTVVLPPFQGVTASTAYPLVTVTSSGYTTTVTRPPMTISVWWISTIVVGQSSGDKTITPGVTLLTTKTWPAFDMTDSAGRVFHTRATETPNPPPPFVSSAIPRITFISGLPVRPTTTPYPTPCATLPGLCTPGEEEQEGLDDDDDDDNAPGGHKGDGSCTGDDCDPGGCGSSCGGCKLGLLCNICIGFNCVPNVGCHGLNCLSCKGPLCNLCTGANCSGCKGPKCTTCKGEDCVSCKWGKCGSTTCTDLQCQPGTKPDDPDEEEDEDEDEDGKCQWNGGGDPDDGGNNGGSSGGTVPGSGNTKVPATSTRNVSGIMPSGTGGGGNGGGTTTKPSATPIQTPDFSNPSTNTNACYDSGQMATREHILQAADQFCKTYDGVVFANSFQAAVIGFGWQEVHKSGLNILIRLEAKYNCRWQMNADECIKQFTALVDGCDQEGIIDKQGGIRQNNCLLWQIDPEQNNDVEPPPAPEPEPEPEAPKTPEIKDGKRPQYDIWTSSLPSSPGGPGMTVWTFGRQGISYYTDYKVCLTDYGYGKSQTNEEMPSEIKDITKVFGKTCSYDGNSDRGGSIPFDKAKLGDVVGYMHCDGWADAKCYKNPSIYNCFATTMFLRATCYW